MRPIYLSLSGLQSYREKQEVDFTTLCEAGVFGIFGPTGSGKSTILDAMTLALYGKVERAMNGTQGIMNHAENTLSVTFVFQLTDSSGARKYRVERQFKRGSDHSINNTLSRLIDESSGSPVVTADKVSEVNQQVQQILGLTMQDFTRAVVLPQGKFAEFLSLKGSERRQMLQRLFRLERYGDLLNSRISVQAKETEMSAKQLAAEQQGLGDASQEAVKEALRRLNEAEEAARKRRTERMEAERQWEEINQRYSWWLELTRLEQESAKLHEQEEHIRLKEAGLQLAEQAEGIVPFLKQLEDAALNKDKQALLHKQSEQELQQARQGLEQAADAYARAKEQLAASEAPLRIRLEHLQEAVQWEAEWKHKYSELNERMRQEQELKARSEQENEQLQKAQATLAKAHARQAELKERQKQVIVPAEWRNRLLEAEKLRDKEMLMLEQAAENRHEVEAAQDVLRNAESANRHTLQRLAEGHRLLEQTWHQGQQYWQQLQFIEMEWQSWHQAAADFCRQMNELLRRQEQENLAHQLAGMVKEGEPCPVCGSLEHPKLLRQEMNNQAFPAAAYLRELEASIAEGKDEQGELRQWKTSYQLTLEALPLQLSPAARDEAAAAVLEEPSSAAAGLERTLSGEEEKLELLEDHYKKLQSQFAASLTKGRAVKEALAEWSQRVKQLASRHTQDEREHREQSINLKAIQAQSRTATDKQQKIDAAAAELRALWQKTYPEWKPDELPEILRQLKHKDQEADDIRQRLDKSVEYIEDLLQQVQLRQQQVMQLDRQQLQLDMEIKGLQETVKQLQVRIHERVGDEPVEQQIAAANRQLNQWLAAEKTCFEHWKECQLKVSELDRKTASQEQQLKSALEQYEEAVSRWHSALESSPFSTGEEVRQAVLSPEEREHWQQETRKYRERLARLQEKMAELTELLGGASLSAELWEAYKQKAAEAQKEDELALTVKAKAERDLEEITHRHKHWLELEEQRKHTQVKLSYLQKLQSVFRGNAFVEYIAEEQLSQVSRAASQRLAELTRQRYSIELDSTGGFIIRDDANGGIRRPVGSLSGGETFLTSLALALALSAQVQLNGRYPLEFFFLDEGFGTLDPELLDTVIGALEKLHIDKLTVGIISHVPELRARLPRRLIVSQAEPAGQGSRIHLEAL
ncbi:AAA family ATPase [Paenibacillus senegalensis]|uniref:AAA family ATPase n=1 Tax=Paenibacillus senegalensis TaxID=1465766 RepID=UPI000288138A|nr:SMC family ATPase [Paenibacillus senegalensis]